MKGLLDRAISLLADVAKRVEGCETGDWYNLASHVEGNAYTIPHDGYIFAYNAANANSYVTVKGTPAGNDTIAFGGQNQRHCLFVKKGMRVYVVGSFSAVRYTPILWGGGTT